MAKQGSRARRNYPKAYRAQILELVRSGRAPEELAKEFEPTARDPKKSRGLVRSRDRRSVTEIFRFVRAHQAQYPVTTMCRVLEVSTSGYYEWCKRPLSERAKRDVVLRAQVVEIHEWSDGTYGRPRIHAELKEQGG